MAICRNRPLIRLCCMYLLSSILLTTIIFVAIKSHSRVSMLVDRLETDIKFLMKEVSEISIAVFQRDANKRSTNTHPPNSPNKLTGPPCNQMESLVRKYVNELKTDWLQAKSGFEATINQIENRLTTTQIPGEILRTDYAMESLGGKVVQVEDTPYIKYNYFLVLLGLVPVQNEPRNVIRSSMSPGDCYAYKGTRTNLTIKLMANVFIDSVTVQHIPENISPSGTINSAPKDFSVYGSKTLTDSQPFFFGSYTYDASLRKPIQIFIFTQVATESHRFVRFHFTSNNGNVNFTCIYRLSVHGKIDTNSTDDSRTV